MKRLAIYAIIIICVIACRKQEKENVKKISDTIYLEGALATYSPVAMEYSKIADAVMASIKMKSDVKTNVVKKFLYRKFNASSVFDGSFERIYTTVVDESRNNDILDIALEILSKSDEDKSYYMTQLIDQNQYSYIGSARNGEDYILLDDKEIIKLPYQIYDFGIPLLTADKKRAIIVLDIDCGPLCGGGYLYTLFKKDNNWHVENGGMIYIK